MINGVATRSRRSSSLCISAVRSHDLSELLARTGSQLLVTYDECWMNSTAFVGTLAIAQNAFRTKRESENREEMLMKAATCAVQMKAFPLPKGYFEHRVLFSIDTFDERVDVGIA